MTSDEAQIRAEIDQRLTKITHHLPGAVFQFQTHPDGSRCSPYVSEGIRSIFGLAPAGLDSAASPLFERIHPEDRPKVEAAIEHSVRTLQLWKSEFRTLLPEGAVRWVNVRATPERLPDGGTLWHGFFWDRTDQMEAELEAYRNSELLRNLFENIPDRVYYKDRQSRYIGGNRAWALEKVETMEAIRGKSDFDFYPPDIAEALFATEQRIMQTGEVSRRREKHEFPGKPPLFLESVKCPIFGPNGKIMGLIGISRDITEQVETERLLLQAKETAEDASRAKSEFLAMMSHEIRTPMNGVIGAASLLSNSDLTADQADYVRTIQVSGESLLVIINDILDYSKIEAGKLELSDQPFDLRATVEDVLDLFVEKAAKQELELIQRIESDVPLDLLGDATRLRQILVNLVGNALKFTVQGEVCLTIRTLPESTPEAPRLEFSVRDTGIGIPSDQQGRLFQPFSQGDASNTRRFGGTGLGLVISRRLAEMMGGDLRFASKEGLGSEFTFSLPFGTCAPAPRNPSLRPALLVGRHVLVIADNSTLRAHFGDLLLQWRMCASLFASTAEAIAALPTLPPIDLAVIDVQASDASTDSKEHSIKQLFTSGVVAPFPFLYLCSVTDRERLKGFANCLPKPIKPAVLCERMLHLLALSPEPTRKLPGRPPTVAQSARILVAEDNWVNQKVIEKMLQHLGFTPVIVPDGEAALEAQRATPFDLILMDVQMPRMDGFTASREIRKLTSEPTRPWIIALTAGATLDDRENAKAAGMNHFLAKPVKLEGLRDTLTQALAQSSGGNATGR